MHHHPLPKKELTDGNKMAENRLSENSAMGGWSTSTTLPLLPKGLFPIRYTIPKALTDLDCSLFHKEARAIEGGETALQEETKNGPHCREQLLIPKVTAALSFQFVPCWTENGRCLLPGSSADSPSLSPEPPGTKQCIRTKVYSEEGGEVSKLSCPRLQGIFQLHL